MILVVADSSPLNILARIGHINILHSLFGRIVIPMMVMQELSHPRTPAEVREWLRTGPAWLEVRPAPARPETLRVDAGESEAISLALSEKADLLLVDDLGARHAAVRFGLKITGTLGVLERADAAGLLDFESAAAALRGTSKRLFFIVSSVG